MSQSPLTMTMTLPCASEFVGVLRLTVSGLASRLDLSIEDIEDVKISISEACTNAIQHAYPKGTPAEEALIYITANLYKDKLELIVQDKGQGFDTSILGTNEQKEKSREKLGLGLGLTFVDNLMDESEIISKTGTGTTVRMVKNAN